MADYPITNVARRIVYTGSAGVGPYAFSFPVLANTDIAVYKNTTLLTLTTDYTVTISSTTGQGSVTLVSAATGSDRITIVGARAIQRSTDFVTGGDFFANTLNTELDSEVIFVQQVAETAERSIKAPVTDPTSINMILPNNTARANKFLSFDSSGNPQANDSLGNYKGNWATSTAYVLQDVVKDTSNSNIYICISAHTSTGSQPISSNTDAAKWSLIVDAASAATSATNAAASASAAATSATNAASSASSASTSASTATTKASEASTSATNAASSASSASSSASSASSSASTATTKASEASTSATNAASSASSASTSASSASSSASSASSSASAASSSASSASTSASNASTSASNAATSATNAASSATSASSAQAAAESARDATLAAYDSFDDRYLGSKTSDPSVDNDGNALVAGAIYFNSSIGGMKVYTGSAWVAAYISGSGYLTAANNLSDLASASTARTNLGLGTAATTSSSAYATAAQGTTADTAYADRLKWDGGSTGLVAATGRTSLGLGTLATISPTGTASSSTFLRGDNSWQTVSVTPTAVSDQANSSTGYFDLPAGTTAQRPGTPNAGHIRYNTDTSSFEGYGSAWGSIGGGATGAGGDQVFYENSLVVNNSYTLTTNKNAMSVGPITIASGKTVTIPSGARWVVLQEKQMASSIDASTSGAGGLISTADNTGTLDLKSGGTTIATVSSTGLAVATGKTLSVGGITSSPYTMKNRIINGAMMIDQRNAGASVTPSSGQTYLVDRFCVYNSVTSKFTAQRSSTAPTGFVNSLLITSSSAYTVGASEVFMLEQRVEGFNIADLAWGTASAATVTLSFWVRSSLTGTFGGVIDNGSTTRSYPFTYTISAANTWEQKTITIAGDTTGTWTTDNSTGMYVIWALGVGSTFQGTANAWAGAEKYSASGAQSLLGTNGATLYITGVQLEKGSTATEFEWRPFTKELQLCQRYYQKSFNYSVAPSNGGASSFSTNYGLIAAYSTNSYASGHTRWLVTMRDTPTMTYYGNSSGYWAYNGTYHVNVAAGHVANDNGMFFSQQAIGGGVFIYGHYAASAEL